MEADIKRLYIDFHRGRVSGLIIVPEIDSLLSPYLEAHRPQIPPHLLIYGQCDRFSHTYYTIFGPRHE